METQFADVNGHRIRYVDQGSGEPLILVHGITGYLEDWGANIAALSAKYRVIALDLIGSGLSDKPDALAYTQQDIAASVLDFMSAIGIEQAHLCGYSSGGRQVILAGAMAPQRVLSVTALAPAGFDQGTIINFRLATVPGLGELLTRPSMAGTKMLMKTAVFDPSVLNEAMLQRKLDMARQPDAQRIFLRTLRGFVAFRGFKPDALAAAQKVLGDVQCPVLLIWGRDDKFLPFRHSATVQAGLRNVQFIAYDKCGHLPQIEHPNRFNADISAFLDGLP
jgi:pimeloyl-ACP methyl ester carboxylesterase